MTTKKATTNWGGSRPGSGAKSTLSLFERAERRVDASAQLAPHRAFILADWPECDEHWRWVITATVNEIVDWADACK
jgi:hypothetical protein